LDLPRLRVYRILLYLAVSVLVVGTESVGFAERLTTAGIYLGLGLFAVILQNLPAGHPEGTSQLWRSSLTVDLAAHAFVVLRMGGNGSPFLLLLALPILVWGSLRGIRGGVWAALGTVLADAAILAPWSPGDPSGDEVAAASRWQILAFHSVAFLLLGAFAALLGRRMEQRERALQRTQDELEQVQLDAESIVGSLATGLLCLDAEGRLRRWNRQAELLLGGPEPLRNGVDLEELGRSNRLGPMARPVADALVRGERAQFEIALPAVGPGFLLEASTTPILGGAGEIRGLVVLLNDLTDRKAREAEERQRERFAFIGRLSAGLAHEIRNSLKPITGSVELLRNDFPVQPGGQSALMEIILREAENLEAFLTEFLSFARDKSLQVEPLILESVVEEEAESLQALSAGSVRLLRPSEASGGTSVLADRAALGQVLRNLGVNALEASGGEGGLELGWQRDTDHAVIFVRDHGPGIPPEIRERVFDPLFSTKTHGTGLGLAIARDLTHRLGGHLTLDPAEGGGTLARIRLPLAGPRRATVPEPGSEESARAA
jgi:signal transduction histidine kinase